MVDLENTNFFKFSAPVIQPRKSWQSSVSTSTPKFVKPSQKLDLYTDVFEKRAGAMSIPTDSGVIYRSPTGKYTTVQPTEKATPKISVTTIKDTSVKPRTLKQSVQESQYKIKELSQKLEAPMYGENVVLGAASALGKFALGTALTVSEVSEIAAIPFDNRSAYLSFAYNNKRLPSSMTELKNYISEYKKKEYFAPGELEYRQQLQTRLERETEKLKSEGKPIQAFASKITLEPQFARFMSDPALYSGREAGYLALDIAGDYAISKLLEPKLVKAPSDLVFAQKTLGKGVDKTIVTKYKYLDTGVVSSKVDDFLNVVLKRQPKQISDISGKIYSKKIMSPEITSKLITQNIDDTLKLLGTKSDDAVSTIFKGKPELYEMSGLETYKFGGKEFKRTFGGISGSEIIGVSKTPKETIYFAKDIAQEPFVFATRKTLPVTAVDIPRPSRGEIIESYIAGFTPTGDRFRGVTISDITDDVSNIGKAVKRDVTDIVALAKPEVPLLTTKELATTGFKSADQILRLGFTSGKTYTPLRSSTILKEISQYEPIVSGEKIKIAEIEPKTIVKYKDEALSKLLGEEIFRTGVSTKKLFEDNLLKNVGTLLGKKGIEEPYYYRPGRLKTKPEVPEISDFDYTKEILGREGVRQEVLSLTKTPKPKLRKHRFYIGDVGDFKDVIYTGKDGVDVLAEVYKQQSKTITQPKLKFKESVNTDIKKIKNTATTTMTQGGLVQPKLLFEEPKAKTKTTTTKQQTSRQQQMFISGIGQRTESRFKSDQDSLFKQLLRSDVESVLTTTQAQRVAQESKQDLALTNILGQELASKQEFLQQNIISPKLVTGLEQRFEPVLATELGFKNILEPIIEVPIVPPTPIPTTIPKVPKLKKISRDIQKSKKTKSKNGVYGVEVRRNGIWSRAGRPSDRFNRNAAIALGIKETGNSPARSFRLVPLSGKANIIKRKPPKLLNRYYKKSSKGNRKLANAFIEKPKFAIDSKDEIQNITKVGWQTNRNLKKQRQKQNSIFSKLLGMNRR